MRGVTKLLRRDIAALDRELARLGRGAGRLRLRLGEALERLAVQGGHHQCGFSSLAAYALERCERSGRWAIESRTVARRLAELPRLRAAIVGGELSWSMGELLSRHASAGSEAELVAQARSCTVRQMRKALKVAGRDDAEAEPEPQVRTLTVTVPVQEAWAFECTRLLVERLEGGKANTDTVMTALLAEGEITLQGMVAAGARDGQARSEDRAARAAAWLAELARYRAEAELRSEARVARGCSGASAAAENGAQARDEQAACDSGARAGEGDAGEQNVWADFEDPVALDRQIRALADELTQRELSLGNTALRLFDADGWRRLGYASAAQYARERVGLSYSALKSRWKRTTCGAPRVHSGSSVFCAGRCGTGGMRGSARTWPMAASMRAIAIAAAVRSARAAT